MTETSVIVLLSRVKRILKKVKEKQTEPKKEKSIEKMIVALSKTINIVTVKRDKRVQDTRALIKKREKGQEVELLEDTLKAEDAMVPLKEDEPPPPKYYVQPVQVVRRPKK